jgi:hypothetical protein
MTAATPARLPLAVVAAHRTGQPLHPELLALGARFDRVAMTEPVYRLIALPGPGVPRGGIVATSGAGASIEVELHAIPTAALGELILALPAPLAVGRVHLVGAEAWGIVCGWTPPGATDITSCGSWPRYLDELATAPL